MKTKTQVLTIVFLGATLGVASAQTTQATAKAPESAPPTLSSTEQAIHDIKNPTSWLNWGGDFRVRNEYFDNLLTLSRNNPLHEQDYFRFRARLWATVTPLEDLSFSARLAAEPREWMKPAGYTPMSGRQGLDMREGIIDNLWVQYANIAGLPATIKVGRQDVIPGRDSLAGDGWLLSDGTPSDGSWTYYFDAARFKYELKEQKTTIEAMGIVQDPKDDAWLPTINNQNLNQGDQREQGAILQVANSSIKAANMALYFIYKNDDRVTLHYPTVGDDADIYTMGGRIHGMLDDHWQYWLEGAYQIGRKSDTRINFPAPTSSYRDLLAYGFNSKVSYLFKDKMQNRLDLSFEALSGDDPDTKRDEMFDSLWGRWPRWSEIGLYSTAAEARIGQQANLYRVGPTWTVYPVKNLRFSTSYYALFSDRNVATRGAPLFNNDNNFRGHFVSGMLEYTFSRHMKGHLWSEFLFPGDFYISQKMMSFLRAEVMFTF
ncbi:MAG TPA: alginate export family protein [Candidatus Paceibacterota bacterium]|nr:alginate export family protein [Verrucomicrobiota bacterium]HSA10552.1 alginate export family protein [Candidatus Paceibacterota bacterium]